jgi:hypothetical protein
MLTLCMPATTIASLSIVLIKHQYAAACTKHALVTLNTLLHALNMYCQHCNAHHYHVLFTVQGMEELEGREYVISVKSPYSFEIDCDTTACSTFVSGYVTQVKQRTTIHCKSLREALAAPEPFLETDFAKFGRPGVLHQVGHCVLLLLVSAV